MLNINRSLIKASTFVLLCTLLLASCASKKEVLYFQDIENIYDQANTAPNIIIQADDLLSIIVSAENPEIAAPFNLPSIRTSVNGSATALRETQSYLVDSNGFIEMPKLGAIKIAGLTKNEAKDLIKSRLEKYIREPIVNFRIINFKVTVLGDVKRPGSILVDSERITVVEAIGQAGDMSITGSRDDVLVIREVNGEKTYGVLDFRSSDLFDSPFYYLKQNDVVVVDQNFAQVQRSVANPNTGVFVSVASLLLSILVIFSR